MPRFLYHVLSSDKFFAYGVENSKGAKMPRGNNVAVIEYPIPLPPLEEQEQAVDILDRFETLCNSLSAGIQRAVLRIGDNYFQDTPDSPSGF